MVQRQRSGTAGALADGGISGGEKCFFCQALLGEAECGRVCSGSFGGWRKLGAGSGLGRGTGG